MFFFAWVDATETTFSSAHKRFDEQVLAFEVEHLEGQIPTLSIDVKNTRNGLRAPGRKAWAWLAWQATGSTVVTPLLFGQLVGFPTNMLDERLTLSLIAKSLDYDALKAALAETLKARPFYDPIFIDPSKRSDPDTVLEGYSALWHVNRTTLDVTISDLVNGEDGTVDLFASDLIYNGWTVTANRPVGACQVTASIRWTQGATGTIDFGKNTFQTYKGDKLLSDWPKAGASLQSGWSVESSSALDVYGVASTQNFNRQYSWQNAALKHEDGDTMSSQSSESGPLLRGPSIKILLTSSSRGGFVDPGAGVNIGASSNETYVYIPLWLIQTSLVLRYTLSRGRTESLAFTVTSDLQPFISADTPAPIKVDLPGTDVGVPIDGTAPIGDTSKPGFFPTDRGLEAVEYCLAVARAHLIADARCVQITAPCKFEKAIFLSCRKMARLHDARFPGASVLGKIVGYKFSANRAGKGKRIGSITIACAIGTGGEITAAGGTPVYVDDSVLDYAIQAHDGAVSTFPTSDVGYSPPIAGTGDDGLVYPLTRGQVTVSDQVLGSATAQAAAITAITPALALAAQAAAASSSGLNAITSASTTPAPTIDSALNGLDVRRRIELKPVADLTFAVEYDLTTTALTVPKHIDLAAVS